MNTNSCKWVRISLHAMSDNGFMLSKEWDSIEESLKELEKIKGKIVIKR